MELYGKDYDISGFDYTDNIVQFDIFMGFVDSKKNIEHC